LSVSSGSRLRVARKYDTEALSLVEAVGRFTETATCVCPRHDAGRSVLMAPHGLEELLAMRGRPTPALASRLDYVRGRVQAKEWLRRWPNLTLLAS
jgi:hypothetical protein